MLKKLAINSASNVGTLFLKLAITFVMTPILIHNLGRYDYGIWEMLWATLGYMGMLDLGIRPAVSRFAARYIAKKDLRAQAEIYSTGWFYLAGVGFVIALILVGWGVFFPNSLAEDPDHTRKYTLLMLILAGQILVVFPSYTAESFMEANQEYVLKNSVTIVNSIAGSVLIWNLITPENALVLLAGVNGLGMSIKYVIFTIYMYRKNRIFRPSRASFSFARLRELFRFSLKTLVQGMSTRMENATDSIVIGAVLGPAMVPLYSVPANLVNYIRMMTYSITHVFMPYFSSLSATNEQERILRVYITASKLTIAAVMILVVGALGLGAQFIELWVGPEIATSAKPVIRILVAFTALPLLNPYESRYLTALNKHGILARWQPLAAVANLGLSLLFIKPWGIVGVAIASLIPALVYRPYMLYYCCGELGISVGRFARLVWLPLVPPVLAMAAAMVVANRVLVVDSYAVLLGVSVASAVLFVTVALATVLAPAERALLRDMMGFRSQ